MKQSFFLSCTVALAMLAWNEAKADAGIYPGDPDKPSHLCVGAEYEGHVIQACEAYMRAITDADRLDDVTLSEQMRRDMVSAARRELMDRIEKYPDEINDTCWSHGALQVSPLYAAVYGNDCELVEFMLNKGALPFLPDYCYSGLELSRDVRAVLSHARSQYNILEIILKAKKAGIEIEGEMPARH
ncbi:MAG: hypothetical protein J1E42_05710 [Akkermansiaceae bacterium]|nr:hypothetical protein [Akkermansiaceae bacterium]